VQGSLPPDGACFYSARCSPQAPDILAASCSTGHALIYDLRLPPLDGPAQSFLAHTPECLDVDWNKYDVDILATGGVDGSVRIWDRRRLPPSASHLVNGGGVCRSFVRELPVHRFAVKRVRSVTIRDMRVVLSHSQSLKVSKDRWSPHHRALVASASYDRTCRV
jgi:peroxin-7